MSSILAYKSSGTFHFNNKNYGKAIHDFKNAILEYNNSDGSDNSSDNNKDLNLLSILYSNISACYALLYDYNNALLYAIKSIDNNRLYIKGYTRKALALFYLKKYEDAKECYTQGLVIEKNNEVLVSGLKETELYIHSKIYSLLNNEILIDNKYNKYPIKKLNEIDIIGIYFSAHWCPPCRKFTPLLANLYNECVKEKKSFEIIFISSDHDIKSFNEYFSTMPWKSIDYNKIKDINNNLSSMYKIEGIPTLLLFNGKGELLSRDGTRLVQQKPYPFL